MRLQILARSTRIRKRLACPLLVVGGVMANAGAAMLLVQRFPGRQRLASQHQRNMHGRMGAQMWILVAITRRLAVLHVWLLVAADGVTANAMT